MSEAQITLQDSVEETLDVIRPQLEADGDDWLGLFARDMALLVV
jgi:hypothetical protein